MALPLLVLLPVHLAFPYWEAGLFYRHMDRVVIVVEEVHCDPNSLGRQVELIYFEAEERTY